MQLIIPSVLGYEVVVRDAVASFAQRYGLPPDRIEDVKTVLCEACTNAIEHGNGSDPHRRVRVCCTVDEQSLAIAVCDEGELPPTLPGKPVEWFSMPYPSRRGLGLKLIVALSDEVSIAADPTFGTCIRLVFYRDPRSGIHTS
jgi:serine/threonine-protein kinase RsbW